ncbi:MAG TPA: ArsA-related P-loop ATPase, partial [Myxococcaceae bacterium]|nr:ArsA-related P-loop ATPase [Myxococcaceae bacterium]
AQAGADAAEFVKNRIAMQQEHMETIWQKFDGTVRSLVPLYETEIHGVPMLARLSDSMFG